MAGPFTCKLQFTITKKDANGTETAFSDSVLTWPGMKESYVVAMEALLIDVLLKLNAIGKAKAEASESPAK
jgi:hypothetical protein